MDRSPGLSRRALLGLAAVGPLAACTREAPAPVPPDPDDLLRSAAADRERALLREYDAALLALPALAARLAPVRAEHAAHLAALLGPEPTATGQPAATTAPPAEPASVQRLVAAERAAATAHGGAALEASQQLAGLLASLAASEASHPVALA
jgi:hypothetical protein